MENRFFFTSPINSHPLSEGFADMCVRFNFRNLNDLLAWPVNHLLKLDGFSYHHYHELWVYLNKNGFKDKLR
ncbi:MAG: hypothetical protein J0I09_02715 [Sphingobacteriia bacterium]|nr:hypothetical protein [Sphingobacteriia bacterium]